jgi:transcriptional regulator with XRE-family HTH domain
MSNRHRPRDEARRAWARRQLEIGDELRTARLIAGLTLRDVATAADCSVSEVSRRERGGSRRFGAEQLAVHAAAVGLRASVKLYPVGGAVRDAAQARHIAAFVARVGRCWTIRLEAPVPISGDLRAVDVLLERAAVRIAVEVITRLTDLQAQLRAAHLKARDIGATRLVIVVAATNANRRVLSSVRPTLVDAFDLDTRRVMADLAAGRDPGRDPIVLV